MFIMLTLIIMIIFLLFIIFLSKKINFLKEKFSIFECGFDILYMSRAPFSLRFFKLILIFLFFDIEIILILPINLFQLNNSNLYYSISFLIIFIILMGLFFEWNQNSLEWK